MILFVVIDGYDQWESILLLELNVVIVDELMGTYKILWLTLMINGSVYYYDYCWNCTEFFNLYWLV